MALKLGDPDLIGLLVVPSAAAYTSQDGDRLKNIHTRLKAADLVHVPLDARHQYIGASGGPTVMMAVDMPAFGSIDTLQ